MADAIPIEQVVDQIKQDVDWVFKAAYARGYNTAKSEIALSGEYERAYQRGKADAQQWIPCSERLPEAETMYFHPKHRYLCQRKNEMFVGARFREPNGMLKEWWDWYGTKIRDEDVTAWMPLPEPWGGEEHDS